MFSLFLREESGHAAGEVKDSCDGAFGLERQINAGAKARFDLFFLSDAGIRREIGDQEHLSGSVHLPGLAAVRRRSDRSHVIQRQASMGDVSEGLRHLVE